MRLSFPKTSLKHKRWLAQVRATLAMLVTVGLAWPGHCAAQQIVTMPANPAVDHSDWWKHAVVYEIYPRSFADSNNDGVGDILGITDHLDYLRMLGVDAIWLTPMFPSPQVDFGYDVSDFDDVDSQFGTIADVDHLIADGRAHGVKLILDLVMNHTSDRHPWFLASKSGRDNPMRDFYIWRDVKPDGLLPTNWASIFGGSAWTFDGPSGQYYYHSYYPQQPDLNWRNPRVEKAMFDAAEWWLKRGVYGYRLDSVGTIFKRQDFSDIPELPGVDEFGFPRMDLKQIYSAPEMYGVLERLRSDVIDHYPGRVLIGETVTETVDDLTRYYGPKNNRIQLPMFLNLLYQDRLDPADLRTRIGALEANDVDGWPCFVLSNHDRPRAAGRYPLPPGTTTDDWAKLTGALLLTLRGTPVLYYGEELGMVNNDPRRVSDVQDIIGKKGWPKEKGRDGERTPMQWNDKVNAGFNTGAKPWLPVAPDYLTRNVAKQLRERSSVLNFYRTLIALRREHPAMVGEWKVVDSENQQVFGFQRVGGGKTVLVLLNLDTKPAVVLLNRTGVADVVKPLATNRSTLRDGRIALDALGVYVAEVKPAALR